MPYAFRLLCLSLALIFVTICSYYEHSGATSSGARYTVMMDSNYMFAPGVTGFAQSWQNAPTHTTESQVTAFEIDLSLGSYWLVDLSSATFVGNPIGVSIYFTGYVTEYPVDYWFAVKQDSGNSVTVINTGVSCHGNASGTSPLAAPGTAGMTGIYHVVTNLWGGASITGASMYPISAITDVM